MSANNGKNHVATEIGEQIQALTDPEGFHRRKAAEEKVAQEKRAAKRAAAAAAPPPDPWEGKDLQLEWDSGCDQLDNYRTRLSQHLGEKEDWEQRRRAATELLKHAEKVLTTGRGLLGEARYDTEMAQRTLERCAEEIAHRKKRIQHCQARVAYWEGWKKAFPSDRLREQRRVEQLRRRATVKRDW